MERSDRRSPTGGLLLSISVDYKEVTPKGHFCLTRHSRNDAIARSFEGNAKKGHDIFELNKNHNGKFRSNRPAKMIKRAKSDWLRRLRGFRSNRKYNFSGVAALCRITAAINLTGNLRNILHDALHVCESSIKSITISVSCVNSSTVVYSEQEWQACMADATTMPGMPCAARTLLSLPPSV